MSIEENIDLLKDVAKAFEFELNDISLDVYKKLYSFKKKEKWAAIE